MCGRFLLLSDEENIELAGIIEAIEEKYPDRNAFALGEMFPGASIPVLANMGNEPFLMHWGFPFLGRARSSQVINARSETLTEKPLFSRLVDEHRCIIPASAFYEWAYVSGVAPGAASSVASTAGLSPMPIGASGAKNKKTKFMIRPSSARTAKGAYYFYMAGLTRKLRLSSGNYADCTVIITTRPSAQMAEIHNRMPVMLDRAMADYWLSNAGIDKIYGSGIMEPWNGNLDIVSA